MKRVQLTTLALVSALSLSLLATPALATDKTEPLTRQQSADQAADYAAQYGGATSLQYALWEDGEITLTGHTGVYSKTENRALTDDTLYGAGSVSKMYTTAAVMLLVQQGKVALDQPVTTYLPTFKMADPRYKDITVRMLLNHSSGLMGGSTKDGFLLGDPDNTAATDELLDRLSTQRLKADPGAYSVYCNDGFTLAELVVEAVSGQTFTAFLHSAITSPAGLDATLTPADEFDRSLLAKTYLNAESTVALPPESLGIIGTGGIYATAADMASFGGLFCRSGLFTQNSLDAMSTQEYLNGMWPADSEDDALGYGLGWDNVNFYPFNQSGIQALVKGGDTLNYHAGLVVLPEYDLAVAVVSSGGVSTYNELAGVRILMDALAERGITVDESGALPQAEPAAMPAELTAFSGTYGSNMGIFLIQIAEDGTLTLSTPAVLGGEAQTFSYYSDGSFRDETQTFLLKFVTEENGSSYLYQKGYLALPGLATTCTAAYTHQKLAENSLNESVLAAWSGERRLRMFTLINESWSSQLWLAAMPVTTAPLMDEVPGYMVTNRIVDENTALSQVQIPGSAGRDCTDIRFYQEDGLEYLEMSSNLFVDTAYAEVISPWSTSYCTIQSTGYARWYQVGAAAGKTMAVTLPSHASFTVYDQEGAVAASSLTGDTSVRLPEGGWIVFVGDPDARFHLTMTAQAD